MASDKKVVVIGDIFADMVTNVVAYPNCGDGTYGTPLKRNGGGCGGNIAAGMGVLGLDTYMICRLGNDEVGHFLKDDMEKYNVKTDGIPLDDEYNSGIVVITVTPDGERTIWVLANGSAYEQLKPEDVRFMEQIAPDAIFISGIMMGVHPAEESIFAELPKWKGRAAIYYDPNLRYPPDAIPPAIKASHQKMCALSDVVLTGKSEMEALGFVPEEKPKPLSAVRPPAAMPGVPKLRFLGLSLRDEVEDLTGSEAKPLFFVAFSHSSKISRSGISLRNTEGGLCVIWL